MHIILLTTVSFSKQVINYNVKIILHKVLVLLNLISLWYIGGELVCHIPLYVFSCSAPSFLLNHLLTFFLIVKFYQMGWEYCRHV